MAERCEVRDPGGRATVLHGQIHTAHYRGSATTTCTYRLVLHCRSSRILVGSSERASARGRMDSDSSLALCSCTTAVLLLYYCCTTADYCSDEFDDPGSY